MNKKYMPQFIVIFVVLIIGIGVLTVNQVNTKNTKESVKNNTVKTTKVKKATFKGSWKGHVNYPNNQKVIMEVKFVNSKNYMLTETNTVSQVWERIYTGTYKVKNDVAQLSPTSVEVSTYASTEALKENSVTNSESVVQSDFYRQFGNQQTGKVTIKNTNLMIEHDHEKIKLHLVK